MGKNEHTTATHYTDLQSLYPTPKTSAERQQDVVRRQQRMQAKQPRHVALKATVASWCIMQIGLLLAMNLEMLWFKGEFFGVLFSYAIALILLLIVVVFVHFMNRAFRAYNITIRTFWILFVMVFLTVYGAVLSGWFGSFYGVTYVASGLYGLLTGALTGILLRAARRQ